jgi:hypothetical protein
MHPQYLLTLGHNVNELSEGLAESASTAPEVMMMGVAAGSEHTGPGHAMTSLQPACIAKWAAHGDLCFCPHSLFCLEVVLMIPVWKQHGLF